MTTFQSWPSLATSISQAVVDRLRLRSKDFTAKELLAIAYAFMVLRRNRLFFPVHVDVVAGCLLTKAPSMSLEELQTAAAVLQRCGRREDMRAFQAQFVRAVQDRAQLQPRQRHDD